MPRTKDRRLRFALYLTAILCGLAFWRVPVSDPDLGWHLIGGAWMWNHHAVPLQDFINSFNPYWHDYNWLAQLPMYLIYRLGGFDALAIASAILMAWICKLLIDIILLSAPRDAPVSFVLACFFGAVGLIAEVYSVRPQMIALAGIALAVRRLNQAPTRWELPYVLLLTILLVNIHVYWAIVPFLWCLHRCIPRFLSDETTSAAYAWGGLAIFSLAGLASPYGLLSFGFTPPYRLMNYALLWEYATISPALKSNIGELRGGLAVQGLTPWLILAYLIGIARALRPRLFRANVGRGLAGIIFPLLAINTVKYVSLFAVASLPFFSEQVGTLVAQARNERTQRWDASLLAISLVVTAFVAVWSFPLLHAARGEPGATYPLEACKRIAGLGLSPRAPRGHVRVLTPFTEGGWCRWALYQAQPDADFRVTTDGRVQSVPVQHYLDSYDIYMVRGDWLATLRRWDPDVLLVPRTFALANVLSMSPQSYRLVFQDDRFAVFVPLSRSG